MARQSKVQSHPFTIYQDTGIPTPEPAYAPSFDDAIKRTQDSESDYNEQYKEPVGERDGGDIAIERDEHYDPDADTGFVPQDGYDIDADDERRVSALTGRTSVSSLPEWTDSNTDAETKPYTPPVIRPSFMRPESVRRMQMRSPPPFSSRSSRQSVLKHSRSRTGTPRSVRASVNALGSPRSQRHISEETTVSDRAADTKLYPLVLLHITLLPIRLPWSGEVVEELLPEATLDQLQVLKGKVSETILQRGILIPHPREEFELLEDRLLEALELEEERVTKCGHFRGPSRDSTSSLSTLSGDGSDSGMGSSVEGLESEVCKVCHHGIRSVKTAGRNRNWTVKIYAANGLMRASAWVAAWSEMERVDVEILPHISEGLRKQLDVRQRQHEEEERIRGEEEDEKARAMFDEEMQMEEERRRRDEELTEATTTEKMKINSTNIPVRSSPKPNQKDLGNPTLGDLPQVYRPSEIPLSVLVKNYVFLLAQDRRNMVIFFLLTVLLLFGIRSAAGATGITTLPGEACTSYQQETGMGLPDVNATVVAVHEKITELAIDTAAVESMMGLPSIPEDLVYGIAAEIKDEPEADNSVEGRLGDGDSFELQVEAEEPDLDVDTNLE